jgi:hypothetical protein
MLSSTSEPPWPAAANSTAAGLNAGPRYPRVLAVLSKDLIVMKTTRFAALLALSLSASIVHAARDETLIQQTRKNQLAHDAQASKAGQDLAGRHSQEKDGARSATAPQAQRQHG